MHPLPAQTGGGFQTFQLMRKPAAQQTNSKPPIDTALIH